MAVPWCTLPYMAGNLGSNDPAIKLFRIQNWAIRVRAAKVLMHRWRDVPLNIILGILDDLYNPGLGADEGGFCSNEKIPNLWTRW